MKLIGFDVETSGTLPEYALQPHRALTGDAWLTSCAWHIGKADSEGARFGNRLSWDRAPNVEDIREVLNVCAANNIRVVAWNAPFDVAWLIAIGLRKEVFKCKWLDAMLLYRHLNNFPTFEGSKLSFGLKAAVAMFYPGHKDYADDIDFHTTDPEELKRLRKYNKYDALFTYGLAHQFWQQLNEGQRRSALLEAASIPLVADTMVHGLAIDKDAAVHLDEKLRVRAAAALMQLKLVHSSTATPEILNSPKQLANLLYNEWKLPVPHYTDKGAQSTDRQALTILARNDPRAALVNEHRESVGNRTKFATNLIESVGYNGDGRTRPAARIFGTYTGRMTYSSKQGRGKDTRQTGVALHQWKRDPEYRRTIQSPEGYQLLEFDFSGQEFRWMAVESNDTTMLSLCQPGEDAHAYMGGRVSDVEYRELRKRLAAGDKEAKRIRQLGKVANLSLQYRTSAQRLRDVAVFQYGMEMSDNEARAIHGTYQLTYYNVPKYWRRQIAWLRKHKWVTNMLGRTVKFSRLVVGGGRADIPWEYASTAINYPIQSMGAEQKYLALAVLKSELAKYDAHFYFELHDGLFIIVPDAKAEKAVHELKKVLSHLPYEKAWQIKLPIGFPVDAKIGANWGDLKDV